MGLLPQGFNWPNSFISNDLKGEARNLIGGYRETLGDEYCFDPEGYGHAFDPLEPVAESRPEIEESGRGSSCPG
jgi:type IV secretory pathway TraG/TraD family ATPase VirD4